MTRAPFYPLIHFSLPSINIYFSRASFPISDVCSGECRDNNDDKYWNADGNTDPQLSRSFVTS